ncbi:MAG: sporulation protein YunB [Bacillota bacterium]
MFKKRRPYGQFTILLFLLLMVLGMFLFIEYRIRPALLSIAEIQVTQLATKAINETVHQEVVRGNIGYEDFISIHKNIDGRVVMMQANTVQVNRIQTEITLEVQDSLRRLEGEKISVPLGQVLGSYIFASYGPRIGIRVIPAGTVKVNVVDNFEGMGINQTRHQIYLDFNTMVRIVIPLRSGEVAVATKVPLAESIIVGEVPQVVANFSGGLLSR